MINIFPAKRGIQSRHSTSLLLIDNNLSGVRLDLVGAANLIIYFIIRIKNWINNWTKHENDTPALRMASHHVEIFDSYSLPC